MKDYSKGLLEGHKVAIEEFSNAEDCDNCGGRVHGQTSYNLGFKSAIMLVLVELGEPVHDNDTVESFKARLKTAIQNLKP